MHTQEQSKDITSCIPGSNLLPATPRRCTRCAQHCIFHVLPEQLLAVIEAAEVLELPQQLNRRLRAIALPSRHVDIIDEEHNLLVDRSTIPAG
jgi:hypothetical protein